MINWIPTPKKISMPMNVISKRTEMIYDVLSRRKTTNRSAGNMDINKHFSFSSSRNNSIECINKYSTDCSHKTLSPPVSE